MKSKKQFPILTMRILIVLTIFFHFSSPTPFVIDLIKSTNIPANSSPSPPPPTPGNGSEVVKIYKFLNAEYYGVIGLGKPSKPFLFSFDTTWSDIMVPSKRCGLKEIACLIHNQYDHTKSSTYQPNGNLVNLTNPPNYAIEGFLSTDNFHLGHMELKNQSFVEATHLSLEPFLHKKVDGIIGLGFAASSFSQSNPLLYNLVKQKNLKPIFSLFMNRDATTEDAGKIILGSTDRRYAKGELKTLAIDNSKKFWKLKLDRITVDLNNKSYPLGENSEAYIDTGKQSISGPSKDIQKINEYLNAFDVGFGNYVVDCREYAKLPNITFTFSGQDFQIKSKYYIEKMTWNYLQVCVSPFNILKGNGDKTWLIGGAFLMQFYTEYDFDAGTIAIAQVINT